jgi:ribonuclease R
MADDYYRFVERAHTLHGENTGRVYRLGDRVTVQVIKVDMERRQIDLGLSEILDRVRESERNRGPRVSRRDSLARKGARPDGQPPHGAKAGKTAAKGARAQRAGRKERASKRGRSR